MRLGRAIGAMLVVILQSSSSSAAPLPPRAQLEDFLDRTTVIVVGATDARQAADEVRKLAEALFDGRTAARRALGGEWDRYTVFEREEFARTFSAVFARAYVEVGKGWLPRDRPPEIRILDEEVAPGERLAIVRTSVRARNGRDLQMDYMMNRPDGRWLVHDVVIDGVSILENYQSQFARVLRTSSSTELIARLRAVAGEAAGPSVASSPSSAPPASPIVAYFPSNRAELDPAAQRALDGAATWLATHEGGRVVVEGHADRQGSARLNLALAERRAQAVRDTLVARGVASERISVVSYGDRRQVCEEPIETCRAQNRRAVVRLTP